MDQHNYECGRHKPQNSKVQGSLAVFKRYIQGRRSKRGAGDVGND